MQDTLLHFAQRTINNRVEDSMPTHLMYSSLQRHSGTQRRLLKQHQDSLPFQQLAILDGIRLDVLGPLNDEGRFFFGEVIHCMQVAFGGGDHVEG